MMPPMDKPMDKPMEKKDCSMECPACGAKLDVQKAPEMEKPMGMPSAKPAMPGERADKMPMDKLKNVLMSAKPKPEPQGY